MFTLAKLICRINKLARVSAKRASVPSNTAIIQNNMFTSVEPPFRALNIEWFVSSATTCANSSRARVH